MSPQPSGLSVRHALLALGLMTASGCVLVSDALEDRTLAPCAPAERRCVDNAPEICGDDRQWSIRESACSGSFPACSSGSCLAVADIAAGNAHTCAVLSDGSIWCWGKNNKGQLGDGSLLTFSVTPRRVVDLGPARAVALGGSDDYGHTCALLVDGTVACWGENNAFQLGDGTTTPSPRPVVVPGLGGVVALTLGFEHSCALLADETVACWGLNLLGQAGQDPSPHWAVVVPSVVPGLEAVESVVAGAAHTCAIVAGGEVRCWGWNSLGQAGQPPESTQPVLPPAAVPGAPPARAMDSGYYASCAIARDDREELSCWGANHCGQLGGVACDDHCTAAGSLPTCGQFMPVSLKTPSEVPIKVALGARHGCVVLDENAIVFCWGTNDFGQVDDALSTKGIHSLHKTNVFHATKLSAGSYHTCALLLSGSVSCWGRNDFGQLGREALNAGGPGAVVWPP